MEVWKYGGIGVWECGGMEVNSPTLHTFIPPYFHTSTLPHKKAYEFSYLSSSTTQKKREFSSDDTRNSYFCG